MAALDRKDRIAQVAADVIAREGVEAATVRRIAAEVGFSTTIVTHYFADKQELLLCAYRYIGNEGLRRLDRLLADHPHDLARSLAALAPMDEEMRLGWGVYVSFWEIAKRDPVFAAEQRFWFDKASERLSAMIRKSSGNRRHIKLIAQTLVSITYGISVQALINPDRWSPRQVRAVFKRAVDTLLGAPAKARSPRRCD